MEEVTCSAPPRNSSGERTCQCAQRHLSIVRYEFGPTSRGGSLFAWEAFAGTIMRWPAGCANRPRWVVRPSDRLPPSMPRRASARGDSERRPGLDPPEGLAVWVGRIVTSAPGGAASMTARQATPCCQVDDVPTANRPLAGPTRAVRTFCRDAAASEQLPAVPISVCSHLQQRRPARRGRAALSALTAHFRSRREGLSWPTK
jgi:hypothetical protein